MTDIQDMFHASAPEAPATEQWPAQVKARRRRRQALTGVLGGVLAVGLAVPLGVTLLNRPAVQLAAPPVSPADAAAVCASGEALVEQWAAGQTTDLKKGATRAWLCGDQMNAGPAEPLTVGVDAAIQAFLDAPAAPLDQACTMEYRMTYTVVFEYADSTLAPVTGELHGCKTLNDSSGPRQGGAEYLETVKGLWLAQRAAQDPQIETAWGDCVDAGTPILPIVLDKVKGAQLCETAADGTKSAAQLEVSGDLKSNAEIARAIAASLATDSAEETSGMFDFAMPERRLQLVDQYGALLTLQLLTDGTWLYYSDDATRVWTPPASLREALGVLLSEPSASAYPNIVVPEPGATESS